MIIIMTTPTFPQTHTHANTHPTTSMQTTTTPAMPEYWVDTTTGLMAHKKSGMLLRSNGVEMIRVCESAPVRVPKLMGDAGMFCQPTLPRSGVVMRVYYDNKWCVATHRRSDAFRCKYVDKEGHVFLFGRDFANVLTRKSPTGQRDEWKHMCETLTRGFTYFFHLSYDEHKQPREVVFMYSRMHLMIKGQRRILLPGMQKNLGEFERYCQSRGIPTLPYSKDLEQVRTADGYVVLDVLNGMFAVYEKAEAADVEAGDKLSPE